MNKKLKQINRYSIILLLGITLLSTACSAKNVKSITPKKTVSSAWNLGDTTHFLIPFKN